MFLCKLFCCRPEPTFLSPRAYFFVAPSEARGPSALACLGMTKREACLGMSFRDAVPKEVRDAVPNEVRDASACARQDKKGSRQDEVEGTF